MNVEDFEYQATKPLRLYKVDNQHDINQRKNIDPDVTIEESIAQYLHLSVATYREYVKKFYDTAIRNWALFASLYEKDIIKAKNERDLLQRSRNILPKIERKDMQDAYKMFLLYRNDVLNGLEHRQNVAEMIKKFKIKHIIIKELHTIYNNQQ